jgi:hypothetical protein
MKDMPESVKLTIEAPNFKITYSGSELPNPNKDDKAFVKWCRNNLRDDFVRAFIFAVADANAKTMADDVIDGSKEGV